MVDWLRSASRSLARWFPSREPSPPPTPGLHTYRFDPPGGQRRIHLRVDRDGCGVLFVDVTDVVHLNPTATRIAARALEGRPATETRSELVASYGWHSQPAIARDVESIYAMVSRYQSAHEGCPTCGVESLERAELFSTVIRAPYKADLAITYECNNDCPHCYNESDRLALESLDLSDWQRIVDRLVTVGVPHLIFTGGEATLYPDLPSLVRYANAQGPICGLNSNGRRFAHADYAQQMAQAGLNHLQVTLGSHDPEVHDRMMHARCFDQTVRGIRNAQQAGIHTITNTTLMEMNAEGIEETVAFLHGLGIRTFAVNGLIYSGGGFQTPQAIPEEAMASILIRIRDTARALGMRFLWYTPTQYCRLSPVELEIGAKRCNAGEYSLCVEPNGDVLPCQSYYVSAGNLLRDPWERIWHGELFRSFRERTDDPRRHGLPEKCWECPDLQLCGGGCRIEREAASGIRVAEGGGCAGCATRGCATGGHTTEECTKGGCGDRRASDREIGFVPIEALQGSHKRRGTGAFAD